MEPKEVDAFTQPTTTATARGIAGRPPYMKISASHLVVCLSALSKLRIHSEDSKWCCFNS